MAAARSVIEAANAQRAAPLSIREALKLIRAGKPKPERRKPKAKDPITATTVADVLAWLPKASPADKRRVAVALAQDAAAMRAILSAKALPRDATPKQIFDRAMGLLSLDDTPSTAH